jgi:hypothetical protein
MSETLFKEVRYDLGSLISFIELGQIGLPDIQRPFVWKNTKVRDLFDSMYRGYPVGYLLFWQNAYDDATRAIGTDSKQHVPRLLIVDGQQRLTSLYAVIKGIAVVRDNYEAEKIEIAFNPLTEAFEVADAAIRRDKAYIPNISTIWSSDIFDVVDSYLRSLESDGPLTEDERRRIKAGISRLHSLRTFPFTALELSATINEEQVAEVFVRINSKGKPLNQADFILTLMSVFWDEGRAQLEAFCRSARQPSSGQPSPYNHFLEPDPDQLLRVSIGLGFRRARLQHVYSILRGKDLETGEFSSERRDQQFATLKKAQARALDLQHWHEFFKSIQLAGYRSGRMISSANNVLYSYALYLLGKTVFGVERPRLQAGIARWFFMAALTGRYTGSPESAMEFDLARLRNLQGESEFLNALEQVCASALTGDFWAITLPNELATSAARSPSMFAYFAALNILDAKALFSKHKVRDLLDPTTKAKRSALERHHLFPVKHLERLGKRERRDVNQVANYALIEWEDNAKIGDRAPGEYYPELVEGIPPSDLRDMHYWHALPDGWATMDYPDFLVRRRELMASVIRDAYLRLAPEEAGPEPALLSVEQLIAAGEAMTVEYKATLRTNLHTGQKDPRMELGVLKTIGAFLNSQGGTLIVGVMDDGAAVGLEQDGFSSEDKMSLHLANLLRDRIGPQYQMYVHSHFEEVDDQRVLRIDCTPSRSPVFVKHENADHFFIRNGPSTIELGGKQAQEYIARRFSSH